MMEDWARGRPADNIHLSTTSMTNLNPIWIFVGEFYQAIQNAFVPANVQNRSELNLSFRTGENLRLMNSMSGPLRLCHLPSTQSGKSCT